MMTDMPRKQCVGCDIEYPATAEFFNRQKTAKFGVTNLCKSCAAKRSREWHGQNKERANQTSRDYREAHSEHVQAYDRERSRSEKRRLQRVKRYHKHKPIFNARSADWKRRNPDKVRVQKQRRRAIQSDLPAAFTEKDWLYAQSYFNGRCAVCEAGGKLHADHWIPLTAPNCPGTVTTNIVPLCQSCNSSKSNKQPGEWLAMTFDADDAEMLLKKMEAFFNDARPAHS